MPLEIFALALLGSSLIYLSLAIFVYWYFRSNPGARSFVALMIAVCIYSTGYYFELHSPNIAEMYFWLKVEYLGIATFPVFFLMFVAQYTQRTKYLRLATALGLFLIPVLTILLVWTNGQHHLFYRSIYLVYHDGLDLMHMVPGPWYWVNVAYVNITVLIGNIMLIQQWRRTPPPLNRQYAAMFFGSLIPWVGFFIYLTGNSPLNLDLSPFGMVITGWIYLYSLMRYRIFDIMPVASSVVLDRMRDGVVVVNQEERIMDMNAAAERFFGPRRDFLGRKLADLFHPVSGKEVGIGEAEDGHLELEEDAPTGNHWLDIMFSPLTSPEGQMRGHVVIIRDITRRRLAQAELERTNNELAQRIQELDEYSREMKQLNDMTVQLQACTRIEDAYPVIIKTMQTLLPTLAGGLYIYSPLTQSMRLACSWNDFAMMVEEIELDECWGLVKGEIYRVFEFEAEKSCQHVEKGLGHHYACHPLIIDGEPYALLHYYYMGTSLSPNKLQMARIGADAIKMALANLKMQENMRQETIRDPLTGLFNRRYMMEILHLEIARSERSRRSLALIMIDVDYYKSINDQYGHSLGDQVLVQVSQVFLENIRRGDVACRFGGDEFVLVMPGVSLEVAVQRAEFIRLKVGNMKVRVEGGGEENITLSMGVAAYPSHGANADALLRAADQALYRAKEQGRNRTALPG